MNLLRFLLVFVSLLGPPIGRASTAEFTEEDAAHVVEFAAVELRALGLQPPPPSPRAARSDHRRQPRRRRPRGSASRPQTRRAGPVRVARRLLFGGDDDDDPDALR